MIDDGSGQITILTGGWTYSSAGGAVVAPDSDPGFVDALGEMFLVPDLGGRGWSFRTFVNVLVNLIRAPVGYLLDLLIPYTPPTYCLGPSIYDGSGQSCEDVDIPCRDVLGETCELIDSLPGVTNAFKQCMKGRCDCGGSFHDRLRVSCAPSDDCGPCSFWDVMAGGCAHCGGSQIWYCLDTSAHPDLDDCDCIDVIFHEMSHACGALDQTYESYRIGWWFRDQCLEDQR